jgi:phospholipid/cholesterol/gamma-HCH transport system substrate-binding protein
LVVAMAVSFVFWYTGQQDKRTYLRYEIYFEGSVSGLSAGSPVRYLGVDVGKVVRIALDPQQRNACRSSPMWTRARRSTRTRKHH